MYEFVYFGPEYGAVPKSGSPFKALTIADAHATAEKMADQLEHDTFTVVSIKDGTRMPYYMWRFVKEYSPRWVEKREEQ